jgi:hypothetical protein
VGSGVPNGQALSIEITIADVLLPIAAYGESTCRMHVIAALRRS